MKETEPGRIRFCDEYEGLLEQFLQALVTWKQVRGLNIGVAPEQEYTGLLLALQSHSQDCVLCEETLRVYVNANGETASTPAWSAT